MARKTKFHDLPVHKDTHDLIEELKGNETYDSFLKKLSNNYKKHTKRFEF